MISMIYACMYMQDYMHIGIRACILYMHMLDSLVFSLISRRWAITNSPKDSPDKENTSSIALQAYIWHDMYGFAMLAALFLRKGGGYKGGWGRGTGDLSLPTLPSWNPKLTPGGKTHSRIASSYFAKVARMEHEGTSRRPNIWHKYGKHMKHI